MPRNDLPLAAESHMQHTTSFKTGVCRGSSYWQITGFGSGVGNEEGLCLLRKEGEVENLCSFITVYLMERVHWSLNLFR